jgi:hypothetical protein
LATVQALPRVEPSFHLAGKAGRQVEAGPKSAKFAKYKKKSLLANLSQLSYKQL